MKNNNTSAYTFTDKYGLVHLLRWLSCFCDENDPEIQISQREVFPFIHDLINFLGSNVKNYYFEDDYYSIQQAQS